MGWSMSGVHECSYARERELNPNEHAPIVGSITHSEGGRAQWFERAMDAHCRHRQSPQMFHSVRTEGGILCLWLVCFGACSSDSVWMGEGHGEQQQQCVGGEGCVRGGIGVDWCG